MSHEGETPLKDVPGWPEEYVEKLAASWITTADQLLAASATPAGVKTLADHLGVPPVQMAKLIEAARACLHPDTARELETPVDTSQFGLGAVPPPGED